MQTFAILINYFTTNKQLYLNFLALPLKTNVKTLLLSIRN